MSYSSKGVGENFRQLAHERRTERAAGPEAPAGRPEPMAVSGRWTPDVVGQLASLARSSPQPWMSEQVVGLIGAADDWYKSGQTSLPWELSGALDMFDQQFNLLGGPAPVIQPAEAGGTTAFTPPAAPQPTGPQGLPAGVWESLPLDRQIAMTVFGSNKLAGAATGAVAGLEGGLAGMVGGAVLGTTLASLAEKYPALGSVFDAFDKAMRMGRGVLGVGGMLGTAGGKQIGTEIGRAIAPAAVSLFGQEAVGEFAGRILDTPMGQAVQAIDVTPEALIANLDDAYVAAQQTYRVLPYQEGIKAMMGGPLAQINFALDPTIKTWDFADPTQTRTLSAGQIGTPALLEYFDRLNDTPGDMKNWMLNAAIPDFVGVLESDDLDAWNATRARLDAEFEQRYGFTGQLDNLIGEILLDPSNYIAPLAAKGIGKAGKLLGASADFVKAFEGASGPVQGKQRFQALSGIKEFGEWQNMSRFEKWLSGAYTPEGAPKLLDVPKYSNPVSKAFGYLTHLDAPSRAKELTSLGSQNFLAVIDRAGGDPKQFVADLELIARNQMTAASELGVKAFGGSEMGALIPAFRDQLPALKKTVDDFYAPDATAMRSAMERISKITGLTPSEVLKKLSDVQKGDVNARTFFTQLEAAAKQAGDSGQALLKSIADGDLTPDALKEMADTFIKNKAPLSETQLTAKLYADLIEGTAQWSAKYFKVGPNSFPVRLSNLVKSAQGLLLLDLSPAYMAQNVIDNTVKLAREGVLGFLTPANAQKYLDDFYGAGMAPTRIAEGLLTDLETGEGAIGKAQRPVKAGPITKAQEAIGSFRQKVGVFSKGSSAVEAYQRTSANVIGLKKAMAELWQPGKGFTRMSADLERRLGPDVARAIYAKTSGSMSGQKIFDAIFTDGPGRTAGEAISETARALGIPEGQMRAALDTLGVTDFLNEKLPPGAGPEQVRSAFGELMSHTQKKFDELHHGQLLARAEAAANTAGVEGALGTMAVFDDMSLTRLEQRYADFEGWARVYELEDLVSSTEFSKLIQEQFKIDERTYKRIGQNEKAGYTGVFEKLGTGSQYTRTLAGNLDESVKAWEDFYAYRKEQLRRYFRSKKGDWNGETNSARWREVQANIKKAYNDVHAKQQELQTARDGLIADALTAKYGDQVRAAADTWLSGVRKLDDDLHQMMDAFRDSLDGMTPEERRAAWPKFLAEQYKPVLYERLRANLEGSRQVYVEATRVEPAKLPTIDKAKATADAKAILTDDRKARIKAERAKFRAEFNKDRPLTATEFVREARDLKMWEVTGLDEAQRARVQDIRQIAAEFGIPSADEAGKPISGFEKHLLATVKKYGGGEYQHLDEVDPAALRDVLTKRAAEKALPAPKYELSPGEQMVAQPRHEMPPEVSDAIRKAAETLQYELNQGEAGKRIFTWVEDQSQPIVTGQSSTNMEWYRDLYFNKKIGRKQVEAGLKRIIEDGTLDKPELKNVRTVKEMIVDRLMGGYIDPLTGAEIPPDPAVLLWANDTDAAARALADWLELGGYGWDETVKLAGSEQAAEMLLKRIAEMPEQAAEAVPAPDVKLPLYPEDVIPEPVTPAPVATFPEPSPADVQALALALEDDAVTEALAGWRTGAGLPKSEPKPKVEAPVDPDPVGIAPPGTVDSLQPEPNRYDLVSQGWNEITSVLGDLEAQLSKPAEPVMKGVDPATAKEVRKWVAQVQGELSDTKLAATKFAELSVDAAMLNYNRRYGIDNALQMAMPYQFWYGRTAIRWGLAAVDHPAWMANWYRLREMQEDLAQPREGYPQRLAGKMQIHAPWLPDWMGDTIYVDPMHQVFGFEAMAAQPLKPLMRDNMNRESRARYILQEQLRDGEITESEFNAAQAHTGPVWDAAMQQATAEVQSEIASPADLVSTMFSPSLPLQWALEKAGILADRDMGAGVGSLPAFSTIQNLTAGITPGGFNIPEMVIKAVGGDASNQRGARWNYYVMRELSNMAGDMPDQTEALRMAMLEKSGPLYQEAVRRVGHENAARSFGSILWTDFFPEGEEHQRALQPVFSQYADAGKLTEFFDQYPEYEAKMQLRNADDPAAMMDVFLRSQVLDRYYSLTDLEKREVVKQFGDLFETNVLDKETRSYDSIDTETWAQWARALKASVPGNAPATPQGQGLDLPTPELSAAYEQYQNLPGKVAYNAMWKLPEPMQAGFKLSHPEIYQYQEQKAIFLATHPELIGYVTSEESFLAGASDAARQEYWSYQAAKAQAFPGISLAWDQYYSLPSSQRAAFKRAHPELSQYSQWKKSAQGQLSTEAWQLVAGESGIEKLRQGGNYQEAYTPDTDVFSSDLQMALFMQTQGIHRLETGARTQLRRAWEADREARRMGLTFDAWLELVLREYDFAGT